MEKLDIQIGERLKQARVLLGYDKQNAFADELGLKNQTYGKYENGERSLPDEMKLRLFNKGINVSWLITGHGKPIFDEQIKSTGEIAPVGYQIPVLRQKVSCGPGQNWENESNIDRYVSVFDVLPRLKSNKVYAFHVSGSSMLGLGIRDGDFVLFDTSKNQDTQDGIYVFALDGDVYCKRLEFEALTRQIKMFSVRVADLEKAELLMTFKADDPATTERLTIFGRVHAWVHPEDG